MQSTFLFIMQYTPRNVRELTDLTNKFEKCKYLPFHLKVWKETIVFFSLRIKRQYTIFRLRTLMNSKIKNKI